MSHTGSVRREIAAAMKKNVRKTTRRFGFDVVRWTPQSSPDLAISRMLASHEVDTVLDVGANEGQYAISLRANGYAKQIVSFEPLAQPYECLRRRANNDPEWMVAPRMAIGNRDGEIQINVASNNGASSSIRDMLVTHRHAAPDVRYIGCETVPISRLDRVAPGLVKNYKHIFLKADVQGYECEVLDGAVELLPNIVGLQLECSLVQLYRGQELFLELVGKVTRQGFNPWGIIPGLVDGCNGRLLQADIVFFRD